MINKNILISGFAVFTMFFGAGNIVLPLLLTQKWESYSLSAFAGFCITGVLVTLIGLIAATIRGDIKNFFSPLGAFGSIAVQIVLILIEGPFGIVPRSMIIAFGGVKTSFPSANKYVFYFVSCLLLYVLASNKTNIINILGKFITPIMLVMLSFLLYFTIQSPTEMIDFNFSFSSLYDGFILGYLTYDLPGAIYFTSIAIMYLKSIDDNPKNLLKNGIKASIFSATLLVFVYFSFTYIGIKNLHILQSAPTEEILPTIVRSSLGSFSSHLFVLFVFLACLTTATAALTIWADFIYFIVKKKISYRIIIIVSLIATFFVSTLNFMDLVKVLSPVLQIIYPILICLSIYNIYVFIKTGGINNKSV